MHPVFAEIGGFPVYTYGVFFALALAAAFAASAFKRRPDGVDAGAVYDLLFIFFFAGIAGARIFYVVQNAREFADAPLLVFNLRTGGLVWYGGFLGAAAAGLVYARVRRLPALALCDFFAPITALAHGVGRVGCFFNGCCYGRQVQAFGVVFPGDAVERAPVQVYEALGLILLAIGLEIASRRRRPAGRILSAYLAAYGALRFVLEAWRADQPTVGFLTPPQWTSVALVLAAFALGLRREGSGVRGKA